MSSENWEFACVVCRMVSQSRGGIPRCLNPECFTFVNTPAGAKDTNPKDSIGASKLPLHLWPQTATALGSLGLLEGALKYGRGNWRNSGVRASIYYDACSRHLAAWFNGQEISEDSRVPHLANALACLAIIVDAEANGKLIDDRNHTPDKEVNYATYVKQLTPFVEQLKELFKDKSPKHWTIADDKLDL